MGCRVAPALALAILFSASGCRDARPRAGDQSGPDAQGHTAPTPITAAANAAVAKALPLGDRQDFDDARRGLLASDPEVVIRNAAGAPIWDTGAYAFLAGDAPPSVNPSLWRQAMLNGIHGLFQVVDGVYQVRGYDLSNLSIIQGRTGWIVVDTLTTRE